MAIEYLNTKVPIAFLNEAISLGRGVMHGTPAQGATKATPPYPANPTPLRPEALSTLRHLGELPHQPAN